MDREILLKEIDRKIVLVDAEIATLTKSGDDRDGRVLYLEGKAQGLNEAYRIVHKLSQGAV